MQVAWYSIKKNDEANCWRSVGNSCKQGEPEPALFSLPHSLPNSILHCWFPHALHNYSFKNQPCSHSSCKNIYEAQIITERSLRWHDLGLMTMQVVRPKWLTNWHDHGNCSYILIVCLLGAFLRCQSYSIPMQFHVTYLIVGTQI